MYSVKEAFLTLQGEGHHAGRVAVFCRFSGCNLWSGREQDRATAACSFCDTDFIGTGGNGGGKFSTAQNLAVHLSQLWGQRAGPRMVVFTGGEPLLQVDEMLISAVHSKGFSIAVETNGTVSAPPGLDWICVSPKGKAPLKLRSGSELKLVYPQADAMPESFADLEFEHLYLQPMDGPERNRNTAAAVDYCLTHPQWRLSTQMHKSIGIR